MADNVVVTAGTGTTIHADEYTHATYGAGKSQAVKIVLGAPGTGVDLVGGAGAVDTGTARVTLGSDDPLVARVGSLSVAKVTDPDSVSASTNAILRGILQKTIDGIVSPGSVVGASSVSVVSASDATAVVDVTLSMLTSAAASGDVVAATEAVSGVLRTDGAGLLQSILVVDKDDQKAALRIYFFDANVTLGAEDAAVSIADGDADNILGWVDIDVDDYLDLGGVSIARPDPSEFQPFVLKAISGTDDVGIAITTSSTPTYTASGLVLRLGVLRD
jgi:hypothetical protein